MFHACVPLVAVNKLDAWSSKSAFVSSATALEKWIALAGLSGQLKGFWYASEVACWQIAGCFSYSKHWLWSQDVYASGTCESSKEGTVTENWGHLENSNILIKKLELISDVLSQ